MKKGMSALALGRDVREEDDLEYPTDPGAILRILSLLAESCECKSEAYRRSLALTCVSVSRSMKAASLAFMQASTILDGIAADIPLTTTEESKHL
jgi:hypothetical protein